MLTERGAAALAGVRKAAELLSANKHKSWRGKVTLKDASKGGKEWVRSWEDGEHPLMGGWCEAC